MEKSWFYFPVDDRPFKFPNLPASTWGFTDWVKRHILIRPKALRVKRSKTKSKFSTFCDDVYNNLFDFFDKASAVDKHAKALKKFTKNRTNGSNPFSWLYGEVECPVLGLDIFKSFSVLNLYNFIERFGPVVWFCFFPYVLTIIGLFFLIILGVIVNERVRLLLILLFGLSSLFYFTAAVYFYHYSSWKNFFNYTPFSPRLAKLQNAHQHSKPQSLFLFCNPVILEYVKNAANANTTYSLTWPKWDFTSMSSFFFFKNSTIAPYRDSLGAVISKISVKPTFSLWDNNRALVNDMANHLAANKQKHINRYLTSVCCNLFVTSPDSAQYFKFLLSNSLHSGSSLFKPVCRGTFRIPTYRATYNNFVSEVGLYELKTKKHDNSFNKLLLFTFFYSLKNADLYLSAYNIVILICLVLGGTLLCIIHAIGVHGKWFKKRLSFLTPLKTKLLEKKKTQYFNVYKKKTIYYYYGGAGLLEYTGLDNQATTYRANRFNGYKSLLNWRFWYWNWKKAFFTRCPSTPLCALFTFTWVLWPGNSIKTQLFGFFFLMIFGFFYFVSPRIKCRRWVTVFSSIAKEYFNWLDVLKKPHRSKATYACEPCFYPLSLFGGGLCLKIISDRFNKDRIKSYSLFFEPAILLFFFTIPWFCFNTLFFSKTDRVYKYVNTMNLTGMFTKYILPVQKVIPIYHNIKRQTWWDTDTVFFGAVRLSVLPFYYLQQYFSVFLSKKYTPELLTAVIFLWLLTLAFFLFNYLTTNKQKSPNNLWLVRVFSFCFFLVFAASALSLFFFVGRYFVVPWVVRSSIIVVVTPLLMFYIFLIIFSQTPYTAHFFKSPANPLLWLYENREVVTNLTVLVIVNLIWMFYWYPYYNVMLAFPSLIFSYGLSSLYTGVELFFLENNKTKFTFHNYFKKLCMILACTGLSIFSCGLCAVLITRYGFLWYRWFFFFLSIFATLFIAYKSVFVAKNQLVEFILLLCLLAMSSLYLFSILEPIEIIKVRPNLWNCKPKKPHLEFAINEKPTKARSLILWICSILLFWRVFLTGRTQSAAIFFFFLLCTLAISFVVHNYPLSIVKDETPLLVFFLFVVALDANAPLLVSFMSSFNKKRLQKNYTTSYSMQKSQNVWNYLLAFIFQFYTATIILLICHRGVSPFFFSIALTIVLFLTFLHVLFASVITSITLTGKVDSLQGIVTYSQHIKRIYFFITTATAVVFLFYFCGIVGYNFESIFLWNNQNIFVQFIYDSISVLVCFHIVFYYI